MDIVYVDWSGDAALVKWTGATDGLLVPGKGTGDLLDFRVTGISDGNAPLTDFPGGLWVDGPTAWTSAKVEALPLTDVAGSDPVPDWP